jgi:hypothetical protein
MNAHRLYHLIGGLFFPIFYWFVPSHKIVLIFFFIIAIILTQRKIFYIKNLVGFLVFLNKKRLQEFLVPPILLGEIF